MAKTNPTINKTELTKEEFIAVLASAFEAGYELCYNDIIKETKIDYGNFDDWFTKILTTKLTSTLNYKDTK